MIVRMWRGAALGFLAAAAVIAMFWVAPIPQDPLYHRFADTRLLLGIPNFWNVATNAPFLAIGIAGLLLPVPALRMHHLVLCIGVGLVALGSGWYHLSPSNSALVFDRLPMTVAFMAIFAAIVADRVSEELGRALLWPLVAGGIASIAWWQMTEAAGDGDLRPYALVQFLPMLLIPIMLLLFKGRWLATRWLWASLATYAAAKLAEFGDSAVFAVGQLLSGHSLKHLLAALAAWWAIRAFQPDEVAAGDAA